MSRALTLYAVRLDVAPAQADELAECLAEQGAAVAVWLDLERGTARLEEFLDTRARALDQRRAWKRALARHAPGTARAVRVRTVQGRDWTEAWKRFFHVRRVSPRIVVKPSWEPFRPRPTDCVVELDPGLSFGTGRHPTTRACLRFLDRISRERGAGSFLDVGCGSGILAIAAAKLGYRPVLALDNDPQAVGAARANLRGNGVSRRVRCRRSDLADGIEGAFDVVAANLQADVLERHARRIARAVARRPPGHLLLAGILRTQYDGIRHLYERLGFREVETVRGKEWQSGCFRRSSYTVEGSRLET